jgi:hypothetical protein
VRLPTLAAQPTHAAASPLPPPSSARAYHSLCRALSALPSPSRPGYCPVCSRSAVYPSSRHPSFIPPSVPQARNAIAPSRPSWQTQEPCSAGPPNQHPANAPRGRVPAAMAAEEPGNVSQALIGAWGGAAAPPVCIMGGLAYGLLAVPPACLWHRTSRERSRQRRTPSHPPLTAVLQTPPSLAPPGSMCAGTPDCTRFLRPRWSR